MELGLRDGEVRLVAPEPAWAAEGAAECARVLAAAAPWALRAEHVGSTAVPGLVAKPVVDVAVAVRDLADAAAMAPGMAGLGYDFPGDVGIPDDFVFGRSRGFRTHLVHVVADGGPRWGDYLAFRDALRGSDSLRSEYAALKTGLAAAHPGDRVGYAAAKAAFVARVLRG
ncbi:GrpB family protein [Kineococcus sp. NPDC059986]|uniref:GrpB family protein n=1 Tax=Kineococcus sp. NPDC059986 TaxID=3155538 RepID=UPI00344D6525